MGNCLNICFVLWLISVSQALLVLFLLIRNLENEQCKSFVCGINGQQASKIQFKQMHNAFMHMHDMHNVFLWIKIYI